MHQRGNENGRNQFIFDINIVDLFQKYKENKPLLTGDKLRDTLIQQDEDDQIGTFLKTKNFSDTIFCSLLWDEILKDYILKQDETNLQQGQFVHFLKETYSDFVKLHGEEIEFHLFIEFVIWLADEDLNWKDIENSNWFDLPAIYRILAPLSTRICNKDVYCGEDWYSTVLKGIPHSALLLPILTLQKYNFLPSWSESEWNKVSSDKGCAKKFPFSNYVFFS